MIFHWLFWSFEDPSKSCDQVTCLILRGLFLLLSVNVLFKDDSFLQNVEPCLFGSLGLMLCQINLDSLSVTICHMFALLRNHCINLVIPKGDDTQRQKYLLGPA